MKTERQIAAFHEAGHSIVAWHFGIECRASIWPSEKIPGRWVGKAITPGVMGWDLASLDNEKFPIPVNPATIKPIRNAAFTWGGILGEALADGDMDQSGLLHVHESFEWLLHACFDHSDDEPETDTERLIAGGWEYKSRPVKIAAGILHRRHGLFLESAALLERDLCLESLVEPSKGSPWGRPLARACNQRRQAAA
jgi:hypothetical protein